MIVLMYPAEKKSIWGKNIDLRYAVKNSLEAKKKQSENLDGKIQLTFFIHLHRKSEDAPGQQKEKDKQPPSDPTDDKTNKGEKFDLPTLNNVEKGRSDQNNTDKEKGQQGGPQGLNNSEKT